MLEDFFFEGKVEILELCEVFKSYRFTNLDWILIRGGNGRDVVALLFEF